MISKTFIGFSIGFLAGALVSYALIADRIKRENVIENDFIHVKDIDEPNVDSNQTVEEDKIYNLKNEKPFTDYEVLSQEDFEEGGIGYKYLEVDWYRGNDVVVDDDFNVCSTISEELLGPDAGKLRSREFLMRNHKLRMDFRVRVLDSEYEMDDAYVDDV